MVVCLLVTFRPGCPGLPAYLCPDITGESLPPRQVWQIIAYPLPSIHQLTAPDRQELSSKNLYSCAGNCRSSNADFPIKLQHLLQAVGQTVRLDNRLPTTAAEVLEVFRAVQNRDNPARPLIYIVEIDQ